MTWTLPLDEMERVDTTTARLIAGTFYRHTDKPLTVADDAPTPDEWWEMSERARLRGVAVAAIRRQEAMETAA